MKVYMCTTKNVLYMYIYLVTLVKSACKVEDEDLLSIPRSKMFFLFDTINTAWKICILYLMEQEALPRQGC